MTVEVWPNSTQEVFHANRGARSDWPCRVRLGDRLIEVTYTDDEERVIRYGGREAGAGHFELNAPAVDGRASLHRFDGGKFLEGYWCEGNVRGMWRITLA
jgi:hypothetical protein